MMASRLFEASFRKQEIGSPRLVPPFESTDVAPPSRPKLLKMRPVRNDGDGWGQRGGGCGASHSDAVWEAGACSL